MLLICFKRSASGWTHMTVPVASVTHVHVRTGERQHLTLCGGLHSMSWLLAYTCVLRRTAVDDTTCVPLHTDDNTTCSHSKAAKQPFHWEPVQRGAEIACPSSPSLLSSRLSILLYPFHPDRLLMENPFSIHTFHFNVFDFKYRSNLFHFCSAHWHHHVMHAFATVQMHLRWVDCTFTGIPLQP